MEWVQLTRSTYDSAKYECAYLKKHMPGSPVRARVGREQKAMTGLFRGNATVPLERTAVAGRAMFSVAPNGYTKLKALNIIELGKSQKYD